MVRKHKSEDSIDIEKKKEMMEQKWEKPEKEAESSNIVIKIKDDISPYVAPELRK